MKNWMDGKQKHILIWTLLLIYLFSAHQLYVLYFLQDGKPYGTNLPLPGQTAGVTYKIADFQPVRVSGRNLYQLHGYAFNAATPLQKNTISIVLIDSSHNLAFPTQAVEHANMIESYPGFQTGMEGAEFDMLLSDQALPPGLYRIGILLQDTAGGSQSFVTTGSTIKKTPNTIQYNAGQ